MQSQTKYQQQRDISKWIPKCMRRGKRFRMDNIILKEKNKTGELTLPKFKTYYRATVSKTRDIGGE